MAKNLQATDADDLGPPKFRNSHCAVCERTLPVNLLTKITISKVSGRSSGSSRSVPTFIDAAAGRHFRGSNTRVSSRTYYRNVDKRLCPDCLREYLAQKRRSFIFKSVGAGCIIAFFFLISGGGKHRDTTQSQPVVAQQNKDHRQVSPQRAYSPLAESPPQAAFAPPQPGFVPAEHTAVVTYFANVRSVPSKSGDVVDQADAGEQLIVVERQGAWVKVKREGVVIGWIHKSNLDMPMDQP